MHLVLASGARAGMPAVCLVEVDVPAALFGKSCSQAGAWGHASAGVALGALVLGALALEGCAREESPQLDDGSLPQLVGGVPVTNETDYPSTVGLYITGSLCTGAKIAPGVILTAAHCFFDKQSRLRIKEGDEISLFTYNVMQVPPDPVQAERRVRATAIVLHPRGRNNKGSEDDIALLKISDVLSHIPSARLQFDPLPAGTDVVITGYGCEQGWTRSNGGPTRLKAGEASAESAATVREDLRDQPWYGLGQRLWYEPRLRRGSLLATRGVAAGSDTEICPGDSGGPVYLKGPDPAVAPIVAINSFAATGGANHGRWSFHVLLSRNKEWITGRLNELSQ